MRATKIYDKNKLIGYVYFFLDYDPNIIDRKEFVKSLTRNVRPTSIGYAGFKNMNYLREHLARDTFDCKDIERIPKLKIQ